MGQQQLIIIVLVALVAGLAVYGGLQWMDSYRQSHERDVIIQRLNILVGEAKKYAAKTRSLGGGDGSFEGFSPPSKLANFSGIRINTTAGDDWVLFQAYGTLTGEDKRTPTEIIAQFDRTTDKWSTLVVVN
jgi:hypothetical protein